MTRISESPYDIFSCCLVAGVKRHFHRIVDEAKSYQNGFGKVVRYAMSHPLGKIEIIGELNPQEVIFKLNMLMTVLEFL